MGAEDEIRSILPVYFDILENRKHARFQVIRSIGVDWSEDMSMEELWNLHAGAMEVLDDLDLSDVPEPVEGNLLDMKAHLANRILEGCILCERRCGVDRKGGETGVCGVGDARIASEFIHLGEEPEIVPSHTIFFAGCTFKCVFCQNCDISQDPYAGARFEPGRVAEIIGNRMARNVNWVGGDPTSNLPFILEVLQCLDLNIPQIWNSNMYVSEETMALLDGVIDLYLTDFKYGNNECGERLSGVRNYFDVVSRNHLEANRQCEMVIRHLVMPNHVECCTKPVLAWISENLDISKTRVNIMDQYRPAYKVRERPDRYPEIRKRLSMSEWLKAYKYGKDLGLNLV